MPIHIIRDVALTIRSFYKRIADFVRYRQATKDMNTRYPDATSAEISHEDVCIICREIMRPWQHQNVSGPHGRDSTVDNGATPTIVDERMRPKKLPCGHILHFSCLRSWLERQQNCPTCRRPVLNTTGITARTHVPLTANQNGRDHGPPNHLQPHALDQQDPQQPIAVQNVFNLGPLRIAFGARQGHRAPMQEVIGNQPLVRQGPPSNGGQVPQMASTFAPQSQTALLNRPATSFGPINLPLQLTQIEQQLIREINGLRVQQNQLHLVRALQGELVRLRTVQTHPETFLSGSSLPAPQARYPETSEQTSQIGQSFASLPQQQMMGYNHTNLPAGMTIPPGWTVLPLQRLPDEIGGDSNPITTGASSQLPLEAVTPSTGLSPNNLSNPHSAPRSNMESSPTIPENGQDNDHAMSHQAVDDPRPHLAPGSLDSVSDHQPHSTMSNQIELERDSNPVSSTSAGSKAPGWDNSLLFERRSPRQLDEDGCFNVGASSPDSRTLGDESAIVHSSSDSERIMSKARAPTVQDSAEDGD